MKILILVFFLFIGDSFSVIYRLNDSIYSRMPPVFHLDDYDQCLINPNGIYCTADIDIVSDAPNELLSIMKNFSEFTRKHFNHTQLHHGICLTHKCKDYLNKSTEDLNFALEGCLNKSLWHDYELKCRIPKKIICNNSNSIEKDYGDIIVACFLLILLLVNIFVSCYVTIFVRDKEKQGNHLLRCFSVPYNYKKLVSSYKNLDDREERLKCFHGFRTITMMSVIYCHTLLPFALGPENPHYVETLYDNITQYIFINGTIVVQTFFIISGCLLSYKLELYAEKREINWTLIPRAIIVTWIKLTPSYAIALAITSTWLRYAGSGPFWSLVITKEVEDCRTKGWTNLLYINNYFDRTQCMVQSWYLGANMQLYIFGFVACVLAWNWRTRKIVMTLLFVIGILTPAAHTYFQDLDAVLMVTPETARTFDENSTFNNVYKRGHTNISNFVLGILLGSVIYRLQVTKKDFTKYKKYRFLLLLTFPAVLGSMYIGSIFYVDGANPPLFARTIYAALFKPVFGIVLSLLIIGCVFKIDNFYRVFLEWNGWKIPSRLCYCAFLLHIMIVRATAGIRRTLITVNDFNMLENAITFIVVSYLAAVPFWLIIDAPLTGFLKICLFGKIRKRNSNPISLKHVNGAENFEETNDREENSV